MYLCILIHIHHCVYIYIYTHIYTYTSGCKGCGSLFGRSESWIFSLKMDVDTKQVTTVSALESLMPRLCFCMSFSSCGTFCQIQASGRSAGLSVVRN